jgi:hypothetical protein
MIMTNLIMKNSSSVQNTTTTLQNNIFYCQRLPNLATDSRASGDFAAAGIIRRATTVRYFKLYEDITDAGG